MSLSFNIGFVRKLQASWQRQRAAARMMQELESSSDRVLSDIGIVRSEIAFVVRDAYRAD